MAEDSDRERIVRLETQIQPIIRRLDSIDDKVGIISKWVENKSGFVAGVMFCIGILAAALGACADHIWRALGGHQ